MSQVIDPSPQDPIHNPQNTLIPVPREHTAPHEIAAKKVYNYAKSWYLTVDHHSFTGVMLDVILDVHYEMLSNLYKMFVPPLFPSQLDQSIESRIKLHMLSKILGTSSFAFPSGVKEKYLGVLEKGAPVPGNVTHGIPEEDPGGQILPTAANPISFNLVTVDKPEFRTLLIGQGMLQGGLITYDGLVRHAASFLGCDYSDITIVVESPRKVKVISLSSAPEERVKVYNKFFIGAITHIGIDITLVPNQIT